jgi:hypothetical protein
MKVKELIIELLENYDQDMDIVYHSYFGEGEIDLSIGDSEHEPRKTVVIIGSLSS